MRPRQYVIEACANRCRSSNSANGTWTTKNSCPGGVAWVGKDACEVALAKQLLRTAPVENHARTGRILHLQAKAVAHVVSQSCRNRVRVRTLRDEDEVDARRPSLHAERRDRRKHDLLILLLLGHPRAELVVDEEDARQTLVRGNLRVVCADVRNTVVDEELVTSVHLHNEVREHARRGLDLGHDRLLHVRNPVQPSEVHTLLGIDEDELRCPRIR